MKKEILIVGIGGCGSNIASLFERKGYNTIHINSSKQDESSVRDAKSVRHLEGFDGCAGNRRKAKKAMAKNKEIIDELLESDEKIIFICFGAGGGTGSGISPYLAEVLAEEGKTVCPIVALPSKDEDLGCQINAYECAQELSENEEIGATFFVDNNSDKTITAINSSVVNRIDRFISDQSVSALGNVDKEEKKTVIATYGAMIISYGNFESNDAAIRSLDNSVFSKSNDGCEYIAVINSKKEIDRLEIAKQYGVPKRAFVGYGASETIIAVSGMGFPMKQLQEIADQARELNSKRQVKKTFRLENLEFNETAPEKKEKKKSARDLLLSFAEEDD